MRNNLVLKFDSNEVLYGISSDEKSPFFYNLKDYVIDKKLRDLLNYDFSIFEDDLRYLSLINKFRLALYEYRGDTYFSETQIESSHNLICRCNKLFKSDLKKIHKEVKGKTKEFYQESNASMLCGNCSFEVKEYLEQIGEELYEGKSLFVFKEEFESELSDFEFHCPPNFEGIYFSIEKIVPGKVRIRARRGDKKIKRDEIHQVLSNFMDSKLTQLFEISIILSE
jgi:hypothetical protein